MVKEDSIGWLSITSYNGFVKKFVEDSTGVRLTGLFMSFSMYGVICSGYSMRKVIIVQYSRRRIIL